MSSRKLYLDHSHFLFGGRSLKEWAATAVKGFKEDGKAKAIIEMTDNPETSWLYELAKKFPEEIGLSIDARGILEDGEVNGQEGKIVKEIVKLNSVDFVTLPAAGGKVERIAASEGFQATIEDLASTVSGLRSVLENEKQKETTEMDKEVKVTRESIIRDYPEVIESLKTELKEEFEAEGKVEEMENQVSDLKSQLSEAENKVKDLEAKVDEFQLVEAEREKRDKVAELLKESSLSESQISEVFEKSLLVLEDEEEIRQHIKDREALVESISGRIDNKGERQEEDLEEGEEENSEEEEEEIPKWDPEAFANSMKYNR